MNNKEKEMTEIYTKHIKEVKDFFIKTHGESMYYKVIGTKLKLMETLYSSCTSGYYDNFEDFFFDYVEISYDMYDIQDDGPQYVEYANKEIDFMLNHFAYDIINGVDFC